MTSCIDSPRNSEAFDSPKTQRTASIILDLPQPFGPTTPTSWPGTWKLVGSTKDLNPDNLMEVKRTLSTVLIKVSGKQPRRTQNSWKREKSSREASIIAFSFICVDMEKLQNTNITPSGCEVPCFADGVNNPPALLLYIMQTARFSPSNTFFLPFITT